jgi:hypothetical protein
MRAFLPIEVIMFDGLIDPDVFPNTSVQDIELYPEVEAVSIPADSADLEGLDRWFVEAPDLESVQRVFGNLLSPLKEFLGTPLPLGGR